MTERQDWMAVLARASAAELEAASAGLLPGYTVLRGPELGLVMLRGRAGGSGAAFNLGEATSVRCTVRSEAGLVGHAYCLGRELRRAELAAAIDAGLQDPARFCGAACAGRRAAARGASGGAGADGAARGGDAGAVLHHGDDEDRRGRRHERGAAAGFRRPGARRPSRVPRRAGRDGAAGADCSRRRRRPSRRRRLDRATAAVLLTLVDADTTLWLDGAAGAAREWVAFHCGAPAAGPAEARFAVALGAVSLADLR